MSGVYRQGEVVAHQMAVRVGGTLTNVDGGTLTAGLYVNGTLHATTVNTTNPSAGRYIFSYTVPAGLTEGNTLEIRVDGEVGGPGGAFTKFYTDQFRNDLRVTDIPTIVDQVWDEGTSGHVLANTFGEVVGTGGGGGGGSTTITTADMQCIADFVLHTPVAITEASTCDSVPAITNTSLAYLLKYMAPNAQWFSTIVASFSSCQNCGSCNCSGC